MTLQYHVALDDGDVAPSVLLPGDPGRVPVIASFWDEAHEVARNREYVTYTGTYQGVPISCTSTGIGAPSTAIALEELARVGATTFLRVGTCGSLQERAKIGDVAIFDSAERHDGASRVYAPLEFPAAAHHEVVTAAIEATARLGLPYHVGTTFSTDLFYTPHEGFAFGGFHQSWARGSFEDARRRGTIAAEMEASVLMVLTRIWGLRGGAISIVADDVFASTNEQGEIDAEGTFDVGATNIGRLARAGSETVRILAERDWTELEGLDARFEQTHHRDPERRHGDDRDQDHERQDQPVLGRHGTALVAQPARPLQQPEQQDQHRSTVGPIGGGRYRPAGGFGTHHGGPVDRRDP